MTNLPLNYFVNCTLSLGIHAPLVHVKLLLSRWLLVFIHRSFCHVCQIYKRPHYFFWNFLTIHDSVYKRGSLVTCCLCCLSKLIAWQVCVACLPSFSSVNKSKQSPGEPHVVRSRLGAKFLKAVSVQMKAPYHKSVLLILNVRIVSIIKYY